MSEGKSQAKCVSEFVREIEDKLSREHFNVTPEAGSLLKKLAQDAYAKGEIADADPAKNSEFAGRIIMNLKFQRMIGKIGNSNDIGKEEIQDLLRRRKEKEDEEQLDPDASDNEEIWSAEADDEELVSVEVDDDEDIMSAEADDAEALSKEGDLNVAEMFMKRLKQEKIPIEEGTEKLIRQYAGGVVNDYNKEKYGDTEGIIEYMVSAVKFDFLFRKPSLDIKGFLAHPEIKNYRLYDNIHKFLLKMCDGGKNNMADKAEEDDDEILTASYEPEPQEEVKAEEKSRVKADMPEKKSQDDKIIASVKPFQDVKAGMTEKVTQNKKVSMAPKKEQSVVKKTEGYPTVMDALMATGRYPTIKDEGKKKTPDNTFIQRAQEAITPPQKILYGNYGYICYSKKEKIEKKSKNEKDDYMKLTVFDTYFRIMVITDINIYICNKVSNDVPIKIERKNIQSIRFFYKKKMLSLGQMQVELIDGNILVVEIENAVDYTILSAKEQYDRFVNSISKVLKSDLDRCAGNDQ